VCGESVEYGPQLGFVIGQGFVEQPLTGRVEPDSMRLYAECRAGRSMRVASNRSSRFPQTE
jgi:hypothetical protein